MALTQGDWTVLKTLNNHSAWYCDVTATTAENDLYTKKTPLALDTRRIWTLFVNTAGATLDGTTLPVDIYMGYSESFALASDGPATVTDGGLAYADAIDDVQAGMLAFTVIPNLAAARVPTTTAGVSGYGALGIAPYYAFNLDGAGTLNAATCRFLIVQ